MNTQSTSKIITFGNPLHTTLYNEHVTDSASVQIESTQNLQTNTFGNAIYTTLSNQSLI